MVQRTVLKVDISCLKCRKKILRAVSALEGVDKLEIDEPKGTLTVTGDADPYDIIIQTRKAGRHAEVVSVGPPPPPPKQEPQKKPQEKKPEEKKPEEKKPEQFPVHDPYNWPQCQRFVFVPVGQYDEPNPSCSIM